MARILGLAFVLAILTRSDPAHGETVVPINPPAMIKIGELTEFEVKTPIVLRWEGSGIRVGFDLKTSAVLVVGDGVVWIDPDGAAPPAAGLAGLVAAWKRQFPEEAAVLAAAYAKTISEMRETPAMTIEQMVVKQKQRNADAMTGRGQRAWRSSIIGKLNELQSTTELVGRNDWLEAWEEILQALKN